MESGNPHAIPQYMQAPGVWLDPVAWRQLQRLTLQLASKLFHLSTRTQALIDQRTQ